MVVTSVSIKEVIGRIIRNTRLQDSSYISSMNEWIPEAMGYMRTKNSLQLKWADVDIDFYKGKLPCGTRSVRAVEHNGCRMKYSRTVRPFTHPKEIKKTVEFISDPAKVAISSMDETVDQNCTVEFSAPKPTISTGDIHVKVIYAHTNGEDIAVTLDVVVGVSLDFTALLVALNAVGLGTWTAALSLDTTKIILTSVNNTYEVTDLTYAWLPADTPDHSFTYDIDCDQQVLTTYQAIQTRTPAFVTDVIALERLPYGEHGYYTELDYINTSLCEGTIRVYYMGIPTDCEGFPLIPDNENYKQALYWYVRGQMIGTGYSDSVFKYSDCEIQFEKYATRALGEIRYPSVDMVDGTVAMGTSLLTAEDYFSTFNSVRGEEGMLG